MRVLVLTILYYAAALYGLRYPVFGIMFLVQIIIFRPESLAWGDPAFGRLHLIAAVLVVAGYLIFKRNLAVTRSTAHQNKNILIFGLFLIWLVIVSILAEASVEMSFEKTLELVKIFVICALFAKLVNTEGRINSYVWVVVISFGLLALWGFQQSLIGNPRLDTLWPGGSNYIASQLALVAPLPIAKVSDRGTPLIYRLTFLACAIFMVLCALASQSRGAFLGLCIGMAVFLMFTRHRMRSLAVVIVVAALVYPWVSGRQVDRISTSFASEEERDTSAESRFPLWQLALRIWQDYPIAGVGLDNFSPVKESYAAKVSDIVTTEAMHGLIFGQVRYPHGVYTGLMAETGVIGIVIYLGLLLRNILVRFPKQFLEESGKQGLYLLTKGAQAGLIGFAFASFFYDLQYIEMLYLQIFFVGALKSYADSMQMPAGANSK